MTDSDRTEYIRITPSPFMRAVVLAAAGLPDLAGETATPAECSECHAPLVRDGGTDGMPTYAAIDGSECRSGVGHIPQDRTMSDCFCIPGRLCALCDARGYTSAIAGYAARIWPARCTAADEARELRQHVDPDAADADDCAPYDTCANCGQPITERSGRLVTMLTGNAECYGNTYRPEYPA